MIETGKDEQTKMAGAIQMVRENQESWRSTFEAQHSDKIADTRSTLSQLIKNLQSDALDLSDVTKAEIRKTNESISQIQDSL